MNDDFQLDGLVERLEFAMSLDEIRFRDYGLDQEEVQRVRRFMLDWYKDLSLRLAEASDPMPDQ